MPTHKELILVAEDEMALGELLTFNLTEMGFQTELVADGRLALLRLSKKPTPDLMLLDWMLPGPSGIDICKKTRANDSLNKMPIIMLTARSDESDIIKGLEAGADDYMTKPFSTKELHARIRALLRRTNPNQKEASLLQFGALTIEPNNYRVCWQDELVPLSPTGFNLLLHLARNANKVLTREALLDAVWGQNVAIELRTIDVNVKRLRALLKKTTKREFIKTAHGFGYTFEP